MPIGTTLTRGLIDHPDPDVLVSLSDGRHEYSTVMQAREAYVTGHLCLLEYESVLESLLQ